MPYLMSTYHVEPGKLEEYLDVVERLQIPSGEKTGLHLAGYWQTSPVSGPPTDLIAIYRFDDWSHWDRRGAPDPETTAKTQEYLEKAQFLRPRYESKFLTPVRFSPLQ